MTWLSWSSWSSPARWSVRSSASWSSAAWASLVLILGAPAGADVFEISRVCKSPCGLAWEPGTGDPEGWEVTYSHGDAWRFWRDVSEPSIPLNELLLARAPAPVRFRVRGFRGELVSAWSEASDLFAASSVRPARR